MAGMSNADPRRMYSWWWDSHISPKNSKWLHENLTDMDSKVQQMIKLIEEDADSFARRAEMYYKKRPELMKMVDDFYRAYRALAARYDHATVVLRQAHRTMSEAFPNQVPLLADDSPVGSAAGSDPCTPEVPSTCALFDPNELQNFRPIKRNITFTEDSDSATSRKGLKELNDLLGSGGAGKGSKFTEGRARKALHFNGSHDHAVRTLSESDRVSIAETEILGLKNAIVKLEAEKEASLLQYQQSLDRLSKLESEVSRAQEDMMGLNERASKAESEVQTLKELLAKLEGEREISLLQYGQCLEKISNLENIVLNAQKDAEIESESLKQDLDMVEAEKEAALVQYKQCLEMTHNLEEKLQHAEEAARRTYERAEKAESEVENLKQALAKLIKEKEAAALQYKQCLELIASLEHKLACAQEENHRLNNELDNGIAKLKGVEEKCLLLESSNQSLHSELESVVQMMGTQSHELTEKQKELGRLWTCIQEERFQFMQAETAFQTLDQMHSQSQEELRNLAAELQHRAQIVKDMETLSQGLQDEIQKVKEENNDLNQLNASSATFITMLEGEIIILKETVQKLEAEVELQVDQRKAIHQEIYSLKEELNDLNQNHQAVLQQVDLVGLDCERFSSSVKKLQDENSELKEFHARDSNEKAVLREKLEQMEKLLEKNAFLENSILELNVELEKLREKVRSFEESYEHLLREKSSLVAEKTTLISQLQITIQNMEKVSEEKKMLESSLLDAKAELEGLRVKSKSLEDSCLFLNDEKSWLMVEREHLVSQLDITQQRLEDLEKSHSELKEKYLNLEKERATILSRLEGLQVSLDAEKQEHASFAQFSETRISLLKEEGWRWKKQFGEQLDDAVGAQIEIFILQKCVQDLEENNISLLNNCKKLLEASQSSEEQISKLEHENQEQQLEVMSLVSQIQILRMGLYQVSKTLDIDVENESEDTNGKDITFVNNILCKLEETQETLSTSCDENQQLMLEKSVLITLLGQLRLEAEIVASERSFLNQELSIQSDQLLLLQKKEETIIEAYQDSQAENSKVLDEKKSLIKDISMLEEQNRVLEEENLAIVSEKLQKKNNEVELWEMETAALFSEQQISNVREVLFEQKIHELTGACESLKDISKVKDMEIEMLKENVCTLENKNDQLATYIPAVNSLASCVTSLENHTIFQAELQKADDRDTKGVNLTSHPYKNEDPISIVHDGISIIRGLEARIKGVDKAVVEMERLAMLEHLDTITKLEAAMRQIEQLKSRCSKRENVNTRRTVSVKPENEVLPKDIMLDQISECSSYGISKRENVAPDPTLELWETESIDLTIRETQRIDITPPTEHHKASKGHKSLNPSVESLVEKELSVDKLEVRQGGNKKKVLERLDSDAQKLTNLQITVQDLKSKVEMIEKNKNEKVIEYDSIKEQLEETEEAITKLFELNSMLTKYVEDGSFSSERKSSAEADESGSARRRKIIERARRGSEKLGRLQLEVQKIQFFLLKLDDKKEKKAQTRITGPNPNVLLRDYLYGGSRTNQNKKKGRFCSCVRPPTKGD